MTNLSGKLLTVAVLATLLACAAAWVLSRRYRAALLRCMSAPLAAASVGTPPAPVPPAASALMPWSAPTPVTAADNRRALVRLTLLLVGLSLLLALTRSVIVERSASGAAATHWARIATLVAVFAWPVLPSLALLWHWSRARLALAALGWYLGVLALVMWRSTEAQSLLAVAGWLGWEIGIPLISVMLLLMGRATRAAAPWLWPLLALLLATSILGTDLLGWLVETDSPIVHTLARTVNATTALMLFALAPWLVAWWPIQWLARQLARAYERKQLSELMVLFTAVWVIAFAYDALGGNAWTLLALAWIPLVMAMVARRRSATRVPTLLVLRVFRQDANVTALFDDVVERWRVSGNTVLIAGTDLADQTLDAADLFDFIDGRLAERFIRSPADLPTRLAAFDWQPDAEGRWRVNECYCHDTTWQLALAALADRADLVLMDLRGFAAHNAGCRFELGVLARAAHVQRVVALTNDATDLATAQADADSAPPGRFVWLALPRELETARRLTRRRVIAALLGDSPAGPARAPIAAA